MPEVSDDDKPCLSFSLKYKGKVIVREGGRKKQPD